MVKVPERSDKGRVSRLLTTPPKIHLERAKYANSLHVWKEDQVFRA